MFKLHIRTDNAAFSDEEGGAAAELARLLRTIATAVENGTTGAPIFDTNGNKCEPRMAYDICEAMVADGLTGTVI